MSTQPMTTVEIPTSVVERIRQAESARAEGIALAEDGDPTGWNKALIDQAIDAYAATGLPFSANDLRHLLEHVDLPGPLYGARFQHASRNRKVIRAIGWETSTKKNTHTKPVARWVGVQQPSEGATA